MHKCEGMCCPEHRGNVQLVHVYDVSTFPNVDYGMFWYCDEAVDTDRARGLVVDAQDGLEYE